MTEHLPTRADHSTPPSHGRTIARLRRIRGQVDGIIRMIEDRRYCPDILAQTAAVRSAMKSVELEILDEHLRHCVQDALATGIDSEEKIAELNRLLRTFTG